MLLTLQLCAEEERLKRHPQAKPAAKSFWEGYAKLQ